MTATTGDGPVIRVRGLTKRYADVQAVAGIDVDVATGEIFGLLGPNGAVCARARGLAGGLLRDRVADVPLAIGPLER